MNISIISEIISDSVSRIIYDKPEILEYLNNLESHESREIIKLINNYDDIGNSILEKLEEIKDES